MRILLALALAIVTACGRESQAEATPTPTPPGGFIKVGRGIQCTHGQVHGPTSYSVYDIGKVHVPAPSTHDAQILHDLLRYYHPPTLRFAFLPAFSVYDADDGPCSYTPSGIMNSPSCNAAYVSARFEMGIIASSGCIMHPRPWIKDDGGDPHAPPWRIDPRPIPTAPPA